MENDLSSFVRLRALCGYGFAGSTVANV